jgi:hypothetical protein
MRYRERSAPKESACPRRIGKGQNYARILSHLKRTIIREGPGGPVYEEVPELVNKKKKSEGRGEVRKRRARDQEFPDVDLFASGECLPEIKGGRASEPISTPGPTEKFTPY